MAYPRLRSMNSDLNRGITEGSYKTVAPDRGGVVESSYLEMRESLDDVWHGIHERPIKYVYGRCIETTTPDYLPTAAPDMTKW
jgi:hypothetical protein